MDASLTQVAADDLVCAFHLFLCKRFCMLCCRHSHLALLFPLSTRRCLTRRCLCLRGLRYRPSCRAVLLVGNTILTSVCSGLITVCVFFFCASISTDAHVLSTTPHETRFLLELVPLLLSFLTDNVSSRGLCHLLTLCFLYPFWGLCCSVLQYCWSHIHLLVFLFPNVSDRLLSSINLNLILPANLSSSTTHQHALHLARDRTVVFPPAILLTSCCFRQCSICLCLCLCFSPWSLDHHISLQSRP